MNAAPPPPSFAAKLNAVLAALNDNGLPVNLLAPAAREVYSSALVREVLSMEDSGRTRPRWRYERDRGFIAAGAGHALSLAPGIIGQAGKVYASVEILTQSAPSRARDLLSLDVAMAVTGKLGVGALLAVLTGDEGQAHVIVELSDAADRTYLDRALHGFRLVAQPKWGLTVGTALHNLGLTVGGPMPLLLTRADWSARGLESLRRCEWHDHLAPFAIAIARAHDAPTCSELVSRLTPSAADDLSAALQDLTVTLEARIHQRLAQLGPLRRSCDVDVAAFVREEVFAADGAGDLVHDGVTFLHYDEATGPTWRPLSDAGIGVVLHTLHGAEYQKPAKEDGVAELGLLDMSAAKVKAVQTVLQTYARAAGGDDWHAETTRGLPLRDRIIVWNSDLGTLQDRALTVADRVLDSHVLPFGYNATATCPRWLHALSDPATGVWGDQPDCAARVAFLQEWLGAALMGDATRYQALPVLTGDGSNGKSVILGVITSLFPEPTQARIAWKDLCGNNAALRAISLIGKRLAFDDDMSTTKPLEETDILKASIVGSPVSGRDHYKGFITFKPRAAWLVACNGLPITRDTSSGFWRRLVLLSFDRVYEVPDPVTGWVKRGHVPADLDLPATLSAELPGIVVWALQGYTRLRAQRAYTRAASTDEVCADARANNDSVGAYLAEVIDPQLPEKKISSQTLYADFLDWTRANGFQHPPNAITFGRRLSALGVPKLRTSDGRGAWNMRHNQIGSVHDREEDY